MSPSRRALIIGVDGATFDVIGPMVERGELPHLSRFLEQGTSGPLTSTSPPLSPPAWISSITGCEPSRHGVYHFHRSPGYPSNGQNVELYSMQSVRVPTLWDWLASQGKRGICVNVPLTYPPQHLDPVIMLSGFGTPPGAEDYGWPQQVAKDLADAGLEFTASEPPIKDFSPDYFRGEGLRVHAASEEAKLRATLHLMERHPWDVCMFAMTMTDRFQHFFWEEKAVLERVYREIDRLVGMLLEAVGPETSVFVMSDHGFGPFHGEFHTSTFLRQHGYLNLRTTSPWKSYRVRLAKPELSRVLSRFGMAALGRKLPKRLRSLRIPLLLPAWRGWGLVDWSQTRAFCADFGVRINLKGREPQGVVEAGDEYERLRDSIVEDLRQLKDPETGAPFLSRVWRREELHRGPLAGMAPDLSFEVRDMEYVPSDRLGPTQLTSPVRFQGTHRMDGVFLAQGPDIQAGHRVEGAGIIDLMPTVLHAAGLPIPEGLDGKLLRDCFRPESLEASPPDYQPALDHGPGDGSHSFGDRDQALLEQRLRQLGYL